MRHHAWIALIVITMSVYSKDMCPAENAQTLLQSKCSKCTSMKFNCDNNNQIRSCSEKLASPNCTSVYQPPKPNTQSHICLYLLRASYHPFLPPETRQIAPPGGGGGGQSAADQLAACECSECAQYLLRCSNQTITETETLVTDIELYDKRKHPKERKLFTRRPQSFQMIRNVKNHISV